MYSGRFSSAQPTKSGAPSSEAGLLPDYTVGYTGDSLMKKIQGVVDRLPEDVQKDVLEIETLTGRKVRITFRL